MIAAPGDNGNVWSGMAIKDQGHLRWPWLLKTMSLASNHRTSTIFFVAVYSPASSL